MTCGEATLAIATGKIQDMRDVSQIRKELKTRLDALNRRIDTIEADLRTAPSADFEEQASETEGDQVLEGVEGSALAEAHQIHAALGRIDAGVYGECETCGEPIGEKRLEALPYAAQCIKCAAG
jgi:RNA polymerase-binding transcription factor DksA